MHARIHTHAMMAYWITVLKSAIRSASLATADTILPYQAHSTQNMLEHKDLIKPGRVAFHLGFIHLLAHLAEDPKEEYLKAALDILSSFASRANDTMGLCFCPKSSSEKAPPRGQFNSDGSLTEVTMSALIAAKLTQVWAKNENLVILHQSKDVSGSANDVIGYRIEEESKDSAASSAGLNSGSGASENSEQQLHGLLPSFFIECDRGTLGNKQPQMFAYAYNAFSLMNKKIQSSFSFNPCILGVHLRCKGISITEWSLMAYCLVENDTAITNRGNKSMEDGSHESCSPELLCAQVPLAVYQALVEFKSEEPAPILSMDSDAVKSFAGVLSALDLCFKEKGWPGSPLAYDMPVNVIIDLEQKLVYKVFYAAKACEELLKKEDIARSLEWNLKYLPGAKSVYSGTNVGTGAIAVTDVLSYCYVEGDVIAKVVGQVIDVLKHLQRLHGDGVCHGDIRGYNMVFAEDGKSCLLDYDFSRPIVVPGNPATPQSRERSESAHAQQPSMGDAGPGQSVEPLPCYPALYVAEGLPDVTRHKDATALSPMAFKHDLFAMFSVLNRYKCKSIQHDTIWKEALGQLQSFSSSSSSSSPADQVNIWTESCTWLNGFIRKLEAIKEAELETVAQIQSIRSSDIECGLPLDKRRKSRIGTDSPPSRLMQEKVCKASIASSLGEAEHPTNPSKRMKEA